MKQQLIRLFYYLRISVTTILGIGGKVNLNKLQQKPLKSFYELEMKKGDNVIMANTYKGFTLLIVNVASGCGFTPQYGELQKLQELYKDRLKILGFPSNDFRGQEPLGDQEIVQFCKLNYGVTFEIFNKGHVIGNEQQPVFEWLTNSKKNGWNDRLPQWNFNKYLLNQEGILIGVFSSAISPLSKTFKQVIDAIK